jgi:hypothetical protein
VRQDQTRSDQTFITTEGSDDEVSLKLIAVFVVEHVVGDRIPTVLDLPNVHRVSVLDVKSGSGIAVDEGERFALLSDHVLDCSFVLRNGEFVLERTTTHGQRLIVYSLLVGVQLAFVLNEGVD